MKLIWDIYTLPVAAGEGLGGWVGGGGGDGQDLH